MQEKEVGGRFTLDGAAASQAKNRQTDYTPACQPDSKRHRMTDASESVYFASKWIEDNPTAWAYVVDLALANARKHMRISIQLLVEIARATYYPRDESEPFKIDNRLRPGLARILAKEHPETAPYIEFRRAACDGMV